MKKLSIIIPAHNEEKRIEKTLKEYLGFFSELKKQKNLDFDIIVVLNACKDNTLEVIKNFKQKELKILNFEQGGKGFAISEGFKEAIKEKSDLIGFIDADGSTPAYSFYEMTKNIKNYDGIIANRWDKKSIIKTQQSFLRKILSRGYNLIIRAFFLFPYRDTQCGAKLFKREILEKNINKITSSQWNFDVALLFCLKKESNAKIKSIPTTWNDEKESKINIKKTPITMLSSAIRLRLIHSPFRFFVRFYRDIVPEKLKFHNIK